MAFSYSFHLSSKSHSVSTTSKLGQISRHNLRDYKSADYNRDDISILIGSDKSIVDDVKDIYHQEFDEALKKYNDGKREDRKIKDYLKHMSDAKADIAAEIIMQIGDKDFWGRIDHSQWKRIENIFDRQIQKLQELVPEFKIASAIIHYDESSPHVHVVGVPVSDGFKRGMEKQTSKTRVFTQERLSVLQDKMRENAEQCMQQCPELFANMELKRKEKGRNKDIPKKKLDEYYKLEAKIANNKEQIEAQNKQIKKNDAVTCLLAQEDTEKIKIDNIVIPEKKSFLGKIEAPERHGTFIDGMDKEQIKAVFRRVKADEGLERAFDSVQLRCNEIIHNAHEEAQSIKDEARDTIEKAQDIVNEHNSILLRAKEWADNLKRRYKELVDKFHELLGRKDRLEREIAQMEAYKSEIAPLKQEVEDLTRKKQILMGQ